MAPKYRLTYFDSWGRGEITRLIFAEAKVEYEDDRVTYAEWPNRKAEMPFGQLPVLFIDDKSPLSQSGAMERYLATLHGINGDNPLEAAYCEMICSTLGDVFSGLPFMEKDPKVKAEKAKKQWEDKILPALKHIDTYIGEKKKEYIIGKFSYADLYVMQMLLFSQKEYSEYLKDIPNLAAIRDRTAQRDGVKEYLATRKDCAH